MTVVRVALPAVPVTMTGTGCWPGLVGAVIVSVVVCPAGTLVGLGVQLAPLGSPEHALVAEKVTELEKLPT
jgi:hypothetical protein